MTYLFVIGESEAELVSGDVIFGGQNFITCQIRNSVLHYPGYYYTSEVTNNLSSRSDECQNVLSRVIPSDQSSGHLDTHI